MRQPLPAVVIQAGGKGERMSVQGESLPKVLMKVKGMPLVERLVRDIAAEGAVNFYIITGHQAERVESHLKNLHGLPHGTRLHFLREFTARGNIGSLSELAHLEQSLLFAFGDLFTNLRFRTLFELHRERGSVITAASHWERHRLQLGHLIVDEDRVVDYREKPEYRFLICSGIMAIEPQALKLLPKDGATGMNRLVMLAVESGLPVTHWNHGAEWIDVNTPERLATANNAPWSTH